MSEGSIEFIKAELLPEMVYNHCFSEVGSREFVDFDSAIVERMDNIGTEYSNTQRGLNVNSELYRARVIVEFSGEAKIFPVIIKLLPSDCSPFDSENKVHKRFQNEEMFYTKMTGKYPTDYFVKCYTADMGRYGRPVIVLEDFESKLNHIGIRGEKIDMEHLKLCMKALGTFHGSGLKLKQKSFDLFREFEAKLHLTNFDEEFMKQNAPRSKRASNLLKRVENDSLVRKVERKLGNVDDSLKIVMDLVSRTNDVSTICHGNFCSKNLLFGYNEGGRPINVKLIDWQTMRHCSAVVDLGPILFFNLPRENRLSEVKELLNIYIEAVKSEQLETMVCDQLMRDIVTNLWYVYVILSLEEECKDDDLVEVLFQLDALGAFDDCIINSS